MFCTAIVSCLLHSITASIQVTEGRMLNSPGLNDSKVANFLEKVSNKRGPFRMTDNPDGMLFIAEIPVREI